MSISIVIKNATNRILDQEIMRTTNSNTDQPRNATALPTGWRGFGNTMRLPGLMLALLLGAGLVAQSQITVKVDSTRNWMGYNNVVGTNGFASYNFGYAVPNTADLRAQFIPTNSPSGWPFNTHGVLRVNTNTYAPGTGTVGTPPNTNFWNYADGTPNRLIEANWYVDVGLAYAGQVVTFEGTVISNSIPLASLSGLPTVTPSSSWHVVAFIKEFTPTYGFIGITVTPNLSPGSFTITRPIGANSITQYGFYTFGPNTAPGSPNSFAGLGVLVEDSDPAITTQPVGQTVTSGTTVNLSVVAVGATPVSYQWKRYGTNLVNGGNISGVTTPNLTIANAQVSDSGPYTVTVTDMAGSVDSQIAQVNVLDILINAAPVNQRVEQGSTVIFSVDATSPSSLSYQWKSVIGGTTNNLSNGANVSGATTATLTLSNVQVAASGFYLVTISTGTGSADAGATLLVKTYAEHSNFLENPGFDNDPTGADESPWVRFPTSDPSFGAFQTTNDVYFGGGNVNVHAGTHVSYTTFSGEWSGIYQDVAASPGQIFAADMWFYNASGDPLPGPPAVNESFLEVQFRSGGTVLQQYITPFMDHTTPQDVWFNLQATNAGGFGTMPPTANARYLVAPPGTTTVRFQVTLHDIANSVGMGSLYYDSARLMLKIPVTLTPTLSGDNVNLSWKTQGATSYQVQYKTDVNAPWTDLEVVAGNGTVVTRSYPVSGEARVYRVLTL
jgi:hypothetical protein